tara:strand:- start:31098 stop:31970 length:873 start_codon:yes stop_codon:yes gene_type:complete
LNPIWSQTRYKDAIFSTIQKRTFTYADTLKLDFYDVKADQENAKPLVILVHGGGFVAGQRDGGEEIGLSTALAQKGFAVASISYRLTMKGKSFGCDCPASIKMKTYVEAVEDVVKSIYYLTNYASDFKIDSNKIILIGSSAGAETILNTVVMKNYYLFKPMPFPNVKIIGCVSFSGVTLSDYLTKENAVPMLFFHGKLDDKVPYGIASHHNCGRDAKGYLILDGPLEITNKLKGLNTSFSLYTDPNGGHEWAELGYTFTSIIGDFLYSNILNQEPIQKIEMILKPIEQKK